jgi:hypothetical protein
MRTQRFAPAALILMLTGCQLMAQPPTGRHHVRNDVGEVLIFSAGLNRLIVAMDTDMDGTDEFVDQWFVLQTTSPVPDTRIHLPVAHVELREGILRVTSHPQRTIYELALDGTRHAAAPAPGYTTLRTDGFGLSHNIGETTLRMPANDRDRCETCESMTQDWGEIDGGGTGATACQAGGLGATQCSLGIGTKSCSVSCTAPSYACCKKTATGVVCGCVH